MFEAPFVSCFIAYEKPGFIFDEDRPEFRYFVPVFSGRCHLCDCLVIDESGNVHPGYSAAGVPIHTDDFVAAFDFRKEE